MRCERLTAVGDCFAIAVLILCVHMSLCVSLSDCFCAFGRAFRYVLCMHVYLMVCVFTGPPCESVLLQSYIYGIMSCRAGRCPEI